MMQAAAFPSRPARSAPACRTRDLRATDSAAHIVAVRALLEEIKVREPSRTDVAQAVAAASGGTLTPAVCGRVADAVLALWNR